MFPHVVRAFSDPTNRRVLVIISDEIGRNDGLNSICSQLTQASIQAHVLGVAGRSGAHQAIANQTGGQFWDISRSKGKHDFKSLLDTVAQTIAKEMTKNLVDGTTSAGTDMGRALSMLAEELRIPPMANRALPPVLVLVTDGQPTDDFEKGLRALMDQPWGKRSVRIAIAIGKDADIAPLRRFIGHTELDPLHADNPEALVKYIKWASTAVLKSASAPASQSTASSPPGLNVPIPSPPQVDIPKDGEVW